MNQSNVVVTVCSNQTLYSPSTGTFILGLFTASTILIGLIGNVLIIHAFTAFQLRARINIYLITLGVLDNLLLLATIFFYVIAFVRHRMMSLRGSQAYFSFYCYPLGNMCRSAIVYTLLFTSIDSFVAVVLPFWHKRYWLLQKRQLKYIVITILISAVLVNLPRCFELEIVHCYDGTDITALRPKALRLRHSYYVGYHMIFRILFCSMGPFVLQAVLTLFVRHRLIGGEPSQMIRGGDESRGNNRLNIAETKMIQMLVLLSAKSLLCLLLPTIIDLVEAAWTSTNFGSNSKFTTLVQLGNFCVVVNSSINFLVYWFFSVKFRKTVFNYKVKRKPSISILMQENAELGNNRDPLLLRQIASIFAPEKRASLIELK